MIVALVMVVEAMDTTIIEFCVVVVAVVVPIIFVTYQQVLKSLAVCVISCNRSVIEKTV